MQSMTRPASYALDLLHDIQPGQGLQTYLSGIDDTLAPYGDSFLIHGGSPQVVEGSLTCDLIVIGFPLGVSCPFADQELNYGDQRQRIGAPCWARSSDAGTGAPDPPG